MFWLGSRPERLFTSSSAPSDTCSMDRIWSPWRSQHIESFTRPSRQGDGSVFARMVAEDADEENLILYRGEKAFVVMNRYPYNNGHLLIVPYRQVDDFIALTDEERKEMTDLVAAGIRWLKQALSPEGFNVGMNLGSEAGAGIPDHVHMHVVPRWSGDTNFMSTLADIRVIPQAMRDTYEKLRSVVDEE